MKSQFTVSVLPEGEGVFRTSIHFRVRKAKTRELKALALEMFGEGIQIAETDGLKHEIVFGILTSHRRGHEKIGEFLIRIAEKMQ